MPTSSPPLRQRRAARLRVLSARLLCDHRVGTLGYARGRHALFVATILEMRCAPGLIGALRRRSKRDVAQHRWHDSGHEHELALAPDGTLVLGVGGVHVGSGVA